MELYLRFCFLLTLRISKAALPKRLYIPPQHQSREVLGSEPNLTADLGSAVALASFWENVFPHP